MIVGHDYLKNFAVFVDYQAQQLEFGSPPVECMWIDVDLKDRIPHVAATLERSHHTLMRMGQTDDEADETVDAMRRLTATNIKAISRDELPPVDPPGGPVLPQAS